jgi:hypothetical protein
MEERMRGTKVFLFALMVSLAATIYFGVRWQAAERRAARLERISLQPPYQRVLLHDLELAQLKKLGLEDPVSAIKADLTTQGELLPFQGVLGGKMAFYDKAGMVLLPGGYVYAPGDDGHYLVHALFRYGVEPGGKIHWKLLDAHKD